MAKKISRFSVYDTEIKREMEKPENQYKGYTALARIVLGKDADEHEVNVLRTYIRTRFGTGKLKVKETKILVYDIETTMIRANVFWTGKQYIGHRQLSEEPKIITVAWKWIGSNKVEHLTWDSNKDDKKLVADFLVQYNKADVVIGVNNDNFDNRWMAARAAKYSLEFNHFVKSFDVQKQAKKAFRIPSYSMEYMAKYFGLTQKLSHEGRIMWEKIQWGTKKESKEYLQKMVDYNIGDIITTEELYVKLRPYFKAKFHVGVIEGGEKFSCPECGSEDVSLYQTTTTAAGTIQRIMKCNTCGTIYKLSNVNYLKLLISKEYE